MATLRRFFLCGAAFLALANISWGQRSSNWRSYRMVDGLPENACASVSIAGNGNVIVRHFNSPAFSELSGYSVESFHSPDPSRGRIYESPGGQIWTASSTGLKEWKDGAWRIHPIAELADDLRANTNSPDSLPPLFPIRQGRVLFLLSDRLMEFNAEDPDQPQTKTLRRVGETGLERFTGMCAAYDGSLWISGTRGIARLPGPGRSITAETLWQEHLPPESIGVQNFREPQADKTGRITMIADLPADSAGTIAEFDGERWTTQAVGVRKIHRAWRGPNQTLWAISADTLFQLDDDHSELVENEELSAHEYYDVACVADGTFWLATSDGLFHYTVSPWGIPRSLRKIPLAAHSLSQSPNGQFWFISGNELHALENDQVRSWPLPAPLSQNPQSVRSLLPLNNGGLLLTSSSDWFQFRPSSGDFSPLKLESSSRINCVGIWKSGFVCVQHFGNASTQGYALETYDGNRFQPISETVSRPPLGGILNTIFTTRNGDLWLANEQGTASLHDGKWLLFISTDHTTPEHAISFAEMADGKIWCATPERIWEFDGHNWLGVKAGMDRINGMLRSQDGSIWVAANSGAHHFLHGIWIENGTEEGLPASVVRELCEDQRGHLWAATTRGLGCYDPTADIDPPRAYIQELAAKSNKVPEGGTITISFQARDKWKSTATDRLLYSYRLDEHDWISVPNASPIPFADLPVGKHHFQLRAMDRSGNVASEPSHLVFSVVAPWYRETRLVLISFVGMAVAIFFAGLAFNRHRQLLRSYSEVELKVTERTRQLEVANNELLHSQKMNALGTLAAGIAHDFNNILSIIKGSAQIIEDNLSNQEKVRTRLDRIKTVVEQGAGIVNAMLGFSRNSEQQSDPCDVNQVIRDTIKLLGDRFLREVEIIFEASPDLPDIAAPKDFMQQILLNFIFNAAEAMDKQKHIILSTRQSEQLPEKLVLNPAAAESYVFVLIKDTGSGITAENLPRIFEPFFTTKSLSTRRGTGLGLSMVYELAKKMEAGLAVESTPNQGSTFTLILPARKFSPTPLTEENKNQSIPQRL